MKVIIYGSQYGTTKKYADELGRRTGIEVKNFEDISDINSRWKYVHVNGS